MTVPAGSITLYDETLAPLNVRVSGTVYEKGTDRMVPNAVISVRDEYGNPVSAENGSSTFTSTSDGVFMFFIKPGTYTLECTKEGFESETAVISLRAGEPAIQNFSLNKNGLTVTPEELEINKGDSYQLSLSNANEIEEITWVSSDTEVVTVDSGGLVTGISGGAAVVTVGQGIYSAQCTVTVKDDPLAGFRHPLRTVYQLFKYTKFEVQEDYYYQPYLVLEPITGNHISFRIQSRTYVEGRNIYTVSYPIEANVDENGKTGQLLWRDKYGNIEYIELTFKYGVETFNSMEYGPNIIQFDMTQLYYGTYPYNYGLIEHAGSLSLKDIAEDGSKYLQSYID